MGTIIGKRETIQGLTHVYEYNYDLAGRLDSVWVDTALKSTYTYDGNGNRLTHTHIGGIDSGFYDDQDRLNSYAGDAFEYNNNGDLQTKISGGDTSRFHYDVFGNLLSVKVPSEDSISISYLIDGQNRRVGKKQNGTLIRGFLYQNQLNPVAELDGSGRILSRFVYGSKTNIPDQIIKDTVIYRIISDHLGSPRLVINAATGAVAQRMDFDEFGNVLYDSNPGCQPFGFAGGLYDWESGLVRFGVRDYSPEIGRWTIKDPIGFAGGLNHYAYVKSNPINLIDPFGLYDNPFLFPPPPSNDAIEASKDVAGAASDFVTNYADLVWADWKNSDKYFHCKANCQASRRGPIGETMSREISEAHEFFPGNIKPNFNLLEWDVNYASKIRMEHFIDLLVHIWM